MRTYWTPLTTSGEFRSLLLRDLRRDASSLSTSRRPVPTFTALDYTLLCSRYTVQRPTRPFEFPDGYNAQFGTERFRLSESLFNPSYIDKVSRSRFSFLVFLKSASLSAVHFDLSLSSSPLPFTSVQTHPPYPPLNPQHPSLQRHRSDHLHLQAGRRVRHGLRPRRPSWSPFQHHPRRRRVAPSRSDGQVQLGDGAVGSWCTSPFRLPSRPLVLSSSEANERKGQEGNGCIESGPPLTSFFPSPLFTFWTHSKRSAFMPPVTRSSDDTRPGSEARSSRVWERSTSSGSRRRSGRRTDPASSRKGASREA